MECSTQENEMSIESMSDRLHGFRQNFRLAAIVQFGNKVLSKWASLASGSSPETLQFRNKL